jgi:hypothetical protein
MNLASQRRTWARLPAAIGLAAALTGVQSCNSFSHTNLKSAAESHHIELPSTCNFSNKIFDHVDFSIDEKQAAQFTNAVVYLWDGPEGGMTLWPDAAGHLDCFVEVSDVPYEFVERLRAFEALGYDHGVRAFEISGQGAWEMRLGLYSIPPKYWEFGVEQPLEVKETRLPPLVFECIRRVTGGPPPGPQAITADPCGSSRPGEPSRH